MENEEIARVEEDTQSLSTGFIVVLYGKAVINLIASLACFFFVAAMLADKKIRNNAYNLYVIFMILPDGINTFFRMMMNLFIAANHGVKLFPPGYFYVDLFFWMFYYISNFYTNTVVTYEIDKLVRNSHQGKRVDPPTVRKVLMQVSVVYLFAIFMSSLMVLPVPFAVFHITDERRGEGTGGSPPGGWYGFWEATAIGLSSIMIPVIYVLFVRIRIWRQKLIPQSGRTRAISLFFLRVVIIFVLFYVPNVLLTNQRERMDDASTGAFIVDTLLGILAACQALTSLYMIWLKDDIRKVVSNTWNKSFGRIWCCCTCSYRKREPDISESVRISGLSGPSKKKMGDLTGSSPVGLSHSKMSGDSHLVDQFKSAWSESLEQAPSSADVEQPKENSTDQK